MNISRWAEWAWECFLFEQVRSDALWTSPAFQGCLFTTLSFGKPLSPKFRENWLKTFTQAVWYLFAVTDFTCSSFTASLRPFKTSLVPEQVAIVGIRQWKHAPIFEPGPALSSVEQGSKQMGYEAGKNCCIVCARLSGEKLAGGGGSHWGWRKAVVWFIPSVACIPLCDSSHAL